MTRELIDRDGAIVRALKFINDDGDAHDCKESLKALPVYVWPVDRWVQSERHEGAHECGNCGALALKIGGPYGGEVLTRFCPHCGAELEREEEADGGQDSGAL